MTKTETKSTVGPINPLEATTPQPLQSTLTSSATLFARPSATVSVHLQNILST